jgi:hypothetical protein
MNNFALPIRVLVFTLCFTLYCKAGVALDDQVGKNNGTVKGKTYFECEPGCGVFVKQSEVKSA